MSAVLTPRGHAAVRVLHERFIAGLLLQGQSTKAIRERLELEDLDAVDDATLKELKARLRPPTRFRPRDKSHALSVAFLNQLGVRELVHETAEADEALAILRTPRVREVVEVGLVARAQHANIRRAALRERVDIGNEALVRFERWFWAVSGFDTISLRALLEVRARRRALAGVSDKDERRAALRAAASDPRVLAASLNGSPANWCLCLSALGHSLQGVRTDKVVEQLMSHAALRALEATLRNAPGDDARARAFSSIVAAAHALHRDLVPADLALREQLSALQLKTDPTPITLLRELTGGNHTVDLVAPPGPQQSAGEEPASEPDFSDGPVAFPSEK